MRDAVACLNQAAPGPTTGVPLAPCHDEFRGPRSDYVRQEQKNSNTVDAENSDSDFEESKRDTDNEDNDNVIVEDIANEDEILTREELLSITNKVRKILSLQRTFLQPFIRIPIPHSEEFGTVIEVDDDTNIDSKKELSLQQKLE
ncbi:hypothetical protein TNCV_4461971 [Trichonephila clavipes]|nr:hypothetical protein TNCV_4461971 [Trichonephila clavipes]